MVKNQTNGYTLLKLICAIQVFYGHIVVHFWRCESLDLLTN